MEMTRVQTVLRLRPELMERVRRNARKTHRSFNSYVEDILDRATETVFPKLPPDFAVSEEIRALRCTEWERPAEDKLEADPRLAYLWEKYDAQD